MKHLTIWSMCEFCYDFEFSETNAVVSRGKMKYFGDWNIQPLYDDNQWVLMEFIISEDMLDLN